MPASFEAGIAIRFAFFNSAITFLAFASAFLLFLCLFWKSEARSPLSTPGTSSSPH